jgi:hypothetical protein
VHEVNLGLFGSGVNQDPPVHHVGLMDGMWTGNTWKCGSR